MIGNDQSKIAEVKEFLDREFTIKDLGQVDFFLGVELHHSNQGISVGQHKYIHDILVETNMVDYKSTDASI